MDAIDWKSLTPETVDTLRDIPWQYVQALGQLKIWDKFIDSFYDEDLCKHSIGVLLKSNVRKNFLKDLSSDKIIKLLDTVNPMIRRHILNMLIENYDCSEKSMQIGQSLLENIHQHLWAFDHTKEIFSLQPKDLIVTAMRARIRNTKAPLMLWRKAVNPENSYKNIRDFSDVSYEYLNSDHFAHCRQLAKRNDFADIIADLLIEALDVYEERLNCNDSKDDSSLNIYFCVVKPAFTNFWNFSGVWNQRKEIYAKVREALLKFPYSKTSLSPIYDFMTNLSLDQSYFNLDLFISHKILTTNDFMDSILPKALENDFKKPLKDTIIAKNLVTRIFSCQNMNVLNFYNALKSISNENEKLSFVWPKLLEFSEEKIYHDAKKGSFYLLEHLLGTFNWNANGIDTFYDFSTQYISYSYEWVIKIVNHIVQTILDEREELVKENSTKYSKKVLSLFYCLTQRYSFNSSEFYKNIMKTPFYLLNAEQRDKILMDVICEPNGKNLSYEINNITPTIYLNLCLAFHDLKKMVAVFNRTNKDQSDEYGFIKNVSINFPTSLTQKSRKVEEYKGTVHVFERQVIPLLRNKSQEISQSGYLLYIEFVKKLLSHSIEINNESFYKLASEVHDRLCRFLNTNLPAYQQWLIYLFIENVCTPLSIYVGMKAHKNYPTYLYNNIIIKFPFTTDSEDLTMWRIIPNLVQNSKFSKYPGIGNVCAQILEKLVNRLFMEIPPGFSFKNTTPNFSYFEITEPNSQEKMESLKTLYNAKAELKYTLLHSKKILKNVISSSEILNTPPTGYSIDPSLLRPNLIKSFEIERVSQDVAPFIRLVKIINEKIDNYDPVNYSHSSTTLIQMLISLLRSQFVNQQYTCDLPEIKFDYTQQNTLQTYRNKIKSFDTSYTLTKDTKNFIKTLRPEINSFILNLIRDEAFDFELLEKVLGFVPLTKEQAKQKIDKIPPKLSLTIEFGYKCDPSVELMLMKKDAQPPEKKRVCKECGQKITIHNHKKVSKKQFVHESWMDIISWDIIKPILNFDKESFCDIMQTKGYLLFNYVNILFKNLKDNKYPCQVDNFDFVAHLLNLCFKDILVEDAEPTPEDPNPKPSPTLFCDDEGNIASQLTPFAVKNARVTGTAKSEGLAKFKSTKVLIAYITSILSLPVTVNRVNNDIYADSLIEILSMSPSDVKQLIGNDNYSYYADHLTNALIKHISFGKDIKIKNWSLTFNDKLIECFFRLFTCDAIHHVALEIVNKKLQMMSDVESRNAIVSAFVSVLLNNTMSFTLHTRTRTVAWCVDPRYVGSPLPKYCLDFLDSLGVDEKCHIDVRKTIVAGCVAYFRGQEVVDSDPVQFTELFEIMKKLYTKAKNQMAPFFCQIVCPSFCEKLVSSQPSFASIMPAKSDPSNLLTGMSFGEISMPHSKKWKVQFDLFVSEFIGASLLLKEDIIIQLVVQVLNNLSIRGGESAKKISVFITAALKECNVIRLSTYFIKFICDFCLQELHQSFTGLTENFISIFTRIRECIDTVNEKQTNRFWEKNDFYSDNYDLLEKTCNAFFQSFQDTINNLEKEDVKCAHDIAKRVLEALNGKSNPTLYFTAFEKLRQLLYIISDDEFYEVKISNYELLNNDNNNNGSNEGNNREESSVKNDTNLLKLLGFIKRTSPLFRIGLTQYPVFVENEIALNKNNITPKVLDEISSWTIDIYSDPKVRSIIQGLLATIRNKEFFENKELSAYVNKLWIYMDIESYYTQDLAYIAVKKEKSDEYELSQKVSRRSSRAPKQAPRKRGGYK
ncbi:hypothetical protein TRFO_42723 [Tritrichomonas foetus]|uniref:Uncharacterized protein n=1 Tax=Tritrichomonas foetus TaxID=1144522 RepID=A0A1J4KVZ0_9EUKA|nr:hypothetical protein TRFO_42723 [Tritrichomonas foetus]|eukprot:OHT15056.1 hypothetical protein TRFO_42723 [Tritrichomonas foetus]